ncbi:hypothetical protein BROUX41_004473 [Berkeleyomyces rouxiae]|uniref:uncharacterized protein n=1 Tax=Berkeleyomyces rouxiae TaxID=2035830 RepID=UPI003B7C9F92
MPSSGSLTPSGSAGRKKGRNSPREVFSAARFTDSAPSQGLWRHRTARNAVFALLGISLAFVILKQAYIDTSGRDYISTLVQEHSANGSCHCPPPSAPTATVPDYFQTTPELFPGPTATGKAAFLAQTISFDPLATTIYEPNAPLQTALPISGMPGGDSGGKNQTGAHRPPANIFRLMGNLSPYQPADGFGVREYPLPSDARIVQLQMLSRHGSRYPTTGSEVALFGERVANASESLRASGELAFLNGWKYALGAEILVPKGRQELFESGVLHAYMYGQMYDPQTKIIARTTTQDRMLKSAENFMAGFFGLEWANNVTLELIIEEAGFNNSLAGYMNCPNANEERGGVEARSTWVDIYLQNGKYTTSRFKSMVEGFDWTINDTYAAQTLCPYETVAFGSSKFCELFTYEEWEGFGYSLDLEFSASSGFQSPTGRAIGIGYQQEVVARLKNSTLDYSHSQINTTLDSSLSTFPLNQSLYLDFSHDSNIVSVLAAFGLRQFADPLDPTRNPGAHNFTIAQLTPFGARLDIEVIEVPHPIAADRSGYLDEHAAGGGSVTRYVHFILNQRTIPLGLSFDKCGADRVDGWCELETFLKVQSKMAAAAQYDLACHGEVDEQQFGKVTDGVPIAPAATAPAATA